MTTLVATILMVRYLYGSYGIIYNQLYFDDCILRLQNAFDREKARSAGVIVPSKGRAC